MGESLPRPLPYRLRIAACRPGKLSVVGAAAAAVLRRWLFTFYSSVDDALMQIRKPAARCVGWN